eukprot:COSAG02_NODE_3041_length_7489_cov_7.290798_7_plen_89_part_00
MTRPRGERGQQSSRGPFMLFSQTDRHTGTQAHRHTGTQAHRHTNTHDGPSRHIHDTRRLCVVRNRVMFDALDQDRCETQHHVLLSMHA